LLAPEDTLPENRKGLIVTLVHGTWGQNSLFLSPNSVFQRYLHDHIDAPVEFLEFPWSGDNTNSARLQAGGDLAHFLRKAFADYPEHAHAVVCHSHGGNVALYALRDLGYASRWDIGELTVGAVRVSRADLRYLRSLFFDAILNRREFRDFADLVRDDVIAQRESAPRGNTAQRESLLRLLMKPAFVRKEAFHRLLFEPGNNLRDPARICCISVGTPFLRCSADAIAEVNDLFELYSAASKVLSNPMHPDNAYRALLMLGGPVAIFFSATLLFKSWLILPLGAGMSWLTFALILVVSRRAIRQTADLQVNDIRVPMFCARMDADEPILGLGVLSRLLLVASRVHRGLRRALTIGGSALMLIGTLLLFAFILLYGGWGERLGPVGLAGAVALASGCASRFICLLLAMLHGALANSLVSHWAGFGLDGWRSGWFLRYDICSKPSGECVEEEKFTSTDCTAEAPGRGIGWRHSVLFNCEKSLAALTAFLSKQSGVKQKTSNRVVGPL
jgi:hypothetical protein